MKWLPTEFHLVWLLQSCLALLPITSIFWCPLWTHSSRRQDYNYKIDTARPSGSLPSSENPRGKTCDGAGQGGCSEMSSRPSALWLEVPLRQQSARQWSSRQGRWEADLSLLPGAIQALQPRSWWVRWGARGKAEGCVSQSCRALAEAMCWPGPGLEAAAPSPPFPLWV